MRIDAKGMTAVAFMPLVACVAVASVLATNAATGV